MDLFSPIQSFSNWITFGMFHLGSKSLLGSALNFFIYDSIKILILLTVIIFLISFLRSYISQEKMRKLLTKKYPIIGNILAALFWNYYPFLFLFSSSIIYRVRREWGSARSYIFLSNFCSNG